MPIHAVAEQPIIRRMAMADVRADRELDGLRIKLLGGGRAPDAPRIFLACMHGDGVTFRCRATGKQLTHPLGKLDDIALVEFRATIRGPRPCALARRRIFQALSFGLLQRGFLDQDSLAFIALSRPAEADHDGTQRRMRWRAA